MKNKVMIFAMAAVAMLAVGCQKERVDGMMLIAEGFNGNGSKVLVNGNASTWATGDEVRINDQVATVSVTSSAASVHLNEGVTAPFYGVYPASIYSSNDGASYTLNLPATYTYATNGTYQVLGSPMVGYTTDESTMVFKHLTAAVTVQVVNYHYDYAIVVDSVQVTSNNYKLCGEMTVSIASDITVDPVATDDASLKSVKMKMSSGITIAAGDSTAVQVPVLPAGDGNKFTVTVWAHRADQASVAVELTRTQTTGGALLRANLGYARYTLGGPFSVSASKKVVFSKGNLQYQASTDSWRFAENQYECVGANPGNTTSDAEVRATQEGWIDLFCWGASGYDGKSPYTKIPMEYTAPGDISGTNYDWGVYNTIEGVTGWYTPTGNEMTFILNNTTVRPSNRYVKAKINNVYGLIVFPDNYVHPTGATALTGANTATTSWGSSTYDASSFWTKMELAGAIFMPTAGYNKTYGDYGITGVNSIGHYWLATYNSSKATYLQVSTSAVGTSSMGPSNNVKSVRLVRDVE